MKDGIYMASAIVVLLASGLAQGADSVAPCAGVADAKSKSRQFFDGKALMVSLSSLEAQGEAKFHPTFAPPASQCLFEKFDAGASPVEAICTHLSSRASTPCTGASRPPPRTA